jgi:hypothetical protein
MSYGDRVSWKSAKNVSCKHCLKPEAKERNVLKYAGIILSGLVLTNGVQGAETHELSCMRSAGAKKAAQYAHECFLVEESEHWPCNAMDSCADIISATRQGCLDIHKALASHPEARETSPLREPLFCKGYLGVSGGSR